jgi:hypothetical protein
MFHMRVHDLSGLRLDLHMQKAMSNEPSSGVDGCASICSLESSYSHPQSPSTRYMFCNIEHCIQRKLNFSSRLHRTCENGDSARRLQGTTLNVVYWHSACLQSRATLSIRFKAGDMNDMPGPPASSQLG